MLSPAARIFLGVAVWLVFLALQSPTLADDKANQTLLQAALSGTVADVDAALKLGADLGATAHHDHDNVDVLIAAVAGQNDPALHYLLSLREWPREELTKALFMAIYFERASCVTSILGRSGPLTISDPSWVYALARRLPAQLANAYQRSLEDAIMQRTHTPDPVEGDWSVLSPGRFAQSASDPALTILDSLVKAGADVNRTGPDPSVPDNTPLLAAASAGDLLLVRALQGLGALLPSGMTEHTLDVSILVGASRNGNSTGAKSLLSGGVNPSEASSNGEYPLPAALQYFRTDIAVLLISNKADPNLFGKDQVSPLDRAARSSDLPMTEALLKAGAKPGLVNARKAWPLRSAVRVGNRGVNII